MFRLYPPNTFALESIIQIYSSMKKINIHIVQTKVLTVETISSGKNINSANPKKCSARVAEHSLDSQEYSLDSQAHSLGFQEYSSNFRECYINFKGCSLGSQEYSLGSRGCDTYLKEYSLGFQEYSLGLQEYYLFSQDYHLGIEHQCKPFTEYIVRQKKCSLFHNIVRRFAVKYILHANHASGIGRIRCNASHPNLNLQRETNYVNILKAIPP